MSLILMFDIVGVVDFGLREISDRQLVSDFILLTSNGTSSGFLGIPSHILSHRLSSKPSMLALPCSNTFVPDAKGKGTP